MDILFVTSTFAPYSSTEQVSESCSALAKALRGVGHKVVVVSPLYASIDIAAHSLSRRLSKLEVDIGGTQVKCEIYDGRTTGGVDLVFIGEPSLFGAWQPDDSVRAEPPSADHALRALVLSAAAVQLAAMGDVRWDVLHANDWITAPALALAKEHPALATAGRVLTIHRPDYDARFGADALPQAELAGALRQLGADAGDGTLSLLASGVTSAHRVVLSSEAVSRHLADAKDGHPLASLLTRHEPRVLGILPGVDSSLWNPLTDVHLPARYDAVDLKGKASCKATLQRQLELPVDGATPLLAILDPIQDDAGHRLVETVRDILRNELQVAVVGGGDPALLDALEGLASRYTDRLFVTTEPERGMQHAGLAGADLLLIPPRPWDAGVRAMQAHRYGTLPIAERSWGFEDVIVDCDAQLQTGNGFLFDAMSAEAADPDLPASHPSLAATQRGLAAFSHRTAFDALRRRVMRIDHSWERAARRYGRVYADAREAQNEPADSQ